MRKILSLLCTLIGLSFTPAHADLVSTVYGSGSAWNAPVYSSATLPGYHTAYVAGVAHPANRPVLFNYSGTSYWGRVTDLESTSTMLTSGYLSDGVTAVVADVAFTSVGTGSGQAPSSAEYNIGPSTLSGTGSAGAWSLPQPPVRSVQAGHFYYWSDTTAPPSGYAIAFVGSIEYIVDENYINPYEVVATFNFTCGVTCRADDYLIPNGYVANGCGTACGNSPDTARVDQSNISKENTGNPNETQSGYTVGDLFKLAQNLGGGSNCTDYFCSEANELANMPVPNLPQQLPYNSQPLYVGDQVPGGSMLFDVDGYMWYAPITSLPVGYAVVEVCIGVAPPNDGAGCTNYMVKDDDEMDGVTFDPHLIMDENLSGTITSQYTSTPPFYGDGAAGGWPGLCTITSGGHTFDWC